MTHLRLLLAGLSHFWRGNAAVLLGVAVGCAVLTGALLVGDSLQGSLRERSERRLGWVTHSLVLPRFFRQSLAERVASASGARVTPALMLQGTMSVGDRQVRGVTVLGVEAGFFDRKHEPGPMLSSALGRALDVDSGQGVTLHLNKPGATPRESSLAKKDVEQFDWPLKDVRVLAESDEGDSFNLRPDLEPPRNVFVPLGKLQQLLGLPGEVNALLAAGDGEKLQSALASNLDIEDWGLSLHTPASRAKALIKKYDTIDRDGKLIYGEWVFTRSKGRKMPRYDEPLKEVPRYAHVLEEVLKPGSPRLRTEADFLEGFEWGFPYISLQSRSLLLPPAVASAALAAAHTAGLESAPTLVYLCRWEVAGRRVAGVVAALDPAMKRPLGPFLPEGVKSINDGQIILVDDGSRPQPKAREEIILRFKPPETHGPTTDRKEPFVVAGTIPLARAAADPYLTPDFPGVTDKDDLGTWDLPFDDEEWKKNVSSEYGDPYWKQARATPKAYITLAKGQKLWGSSRFGELTSIRLAGGEREAGIFRVALREALKASDGGFTFDAVRATSMEASQGGTPFGLLFLGFSCFLIIASLLLVGLLYRLNLDQRAAQVGLLMAEGFRTSTVRWHFLAEGGLLALLGVLLGSFLALAYSRLLIQLLAALWPGGVLKSFLAPHATAMSFAIGIGGALLAAVLTIAWVVRVLGQAPPRALLQGQTIDELGEATPRVGWWTWGTLATTLIGGAALLFLAPSMKGHEAKAGSFFGAGALFLTAGLAGLHAWMRGTRQARIRGVMSLALRNAARHPLRSMLTVGLLASAAFLIAAVESFRRQAKAGDGTIDAADGGFALVAESDLPVIRDLNTPPGREEILKGLPPGERADAAALLMETTIIGLRARAGDDASCLNLYKPRTPRVLGVPGSLIRRGGFVFDAVRRGAEKKPWSALSPGEQEGVSPPNALPIPAFGESNTVTWMLRQGLGGTVEVEDEKGKKADLVIAGLMHDSVFQSSLLVSEENFLRLFPSEEGFRYFLIAPPAGREVDVKRVLERGLRDRGKEVSFTKDRLAAFLAVENTYLTTFQALGGLGLILGSLGVAVVLLRSVWERRAELALLRALGWRNGQVAWLVLAENLFLLLLGLLIGAAAAVLSVSPQLATGQASIPWANLGLLFAGVLVVGLVACVFAVMGTLRAAIVPALRRE